MIDPTAQVGPDPIDISPIELDAPTASLARNSVARLLADSAGVVFGILSGVITARWLGPSGKGLFSSLTFLAGVVMQVTLVGLGDAAVVLVGQKRVSLQHALSATIAAVACSAVVGMTVLWVVAVLLFHRDWNQVRAAALVTCLGLPLVLGTQVLSFTLNAQERIVATSAALGLTSAVATLSLWLFVAVIPWSITGAALATVVGSSVGFAIVTTLVVRSRLSFRPRWDGGYLGSACRYGVPIATSYLLVSLAGRVDLLIVYSLVGAGPAGQYSVALTVGALIGLLPLAISYASFPRIARLDEADAVRLTADVTRVGLAAATLAVIPIAVGIPFGIPLLFGAAFRPAVMPALILLGSGIVASGQLLLSRASAARGRPGLLVKSYGLSLVVMCLLDFILIRPFGIGGAAVAALAGPVAGLLYCVAEYHRSSSWPLPLSQFVPRPHDFKVLLAQLSQLLPRSARPTSSSAGPGGP